MAKIYNSDVTKGLAQNAGIQINVDKVPNELAEKIVPTFETNPDKLRKITIVRSGTGAATIYTTPTDRDFYLCAAHLSLSNSTAGQNAYLSVLATPKDEANVTIGNLYVRTTALIDMGHDNVFLNFNDKPILLARGTNITSTIANAASSRVIIYGYIDDSKA